MTAFWSATINGALLSSALAAVVWVAMTLTPRGVLNAATRYAIWCAVLIIVLALPLSNVTMVAVRPVASHPVSQLANVVGAETNVAAPVIPHPAVVRRVWHPLEIPAATWLRPLLFFWISCSTLLLFRVLISYIALYRRSACAIGAPADNPLPGTRRDARIAISNEIQIPGAAGPFRPAILIPEKLMDQLSSRDLAQVIGHEAAHLARFDDYALLAQRIIEAVFALHPGVRFVTRQIDLEREIACDDMVAEATDNPRAYAGCLTRMVALCGGVRNSLAATSVIGTRSQFSRRVELLVRKNRSTQAGFLPRRFAGVAAMLICLAGLMAKAPKLVAFTAPRLIASAASILIRPEPVAPVYLPAHADVKLLAQVEPPPLPERSDVPAAPATPAGPAALPAPAAPGAPAAPPAPAALPAPPKPLYVLGPNDVIGVAVFNEPNLSATYAIAPDGRLSMPLLGTFSADSLTLPELRDVIRGKLIRDAWMSNPTVNVQLLRSNSKKYTLLGATHFAGPVPLLKATTVLDAITDEGGFTARANTQDIVILRGTKMFHFNYNDVSNGKNLDQNILLEDGDLIIVKE